MVTLDVGCGDDKKGDIGVDLRKLLRVDVVCDVHNLPFGNEAFTEVRSSVVIEHTLNPFQFIKEQVRVLKSNGILRCEADNARYWRFHINISPFGEDFPTHFKSERYSPSEEHHMIFYPESIVQLFKLAGVKEVKFFYVQPSRKADKLLRLIFPFFYKNTWQRFVVTGQKKEHGNI